MGLHRGAREGFVPCLGQGRPAEWASLPHLDAPSSRRGRAEHPQLRVRLDARWQQVRPAGAPSRCAPQVSGGSPRAIRSAPFSVGEPRCCLGEHPGLGGCGPAGGPCVLAPSPGPGDAQTLPRRPGPSPLPPGTYGPASVPAASPPVASAPLWQISSVPDRSPSFPFQPNLSQ